MFRCNQYAPVLWKGVRWSFVKKFFSNKITVSRSSFRGVFQRYISKYLIGIIRKIQTRIIPNTDTFYSVLESKFFLWCQIRYFEIYRWKTPLKELFFICRRANCNFIRKELLHKTSTNSFSETLIKCPLIFFIIFVKKKML